MLPPAWNGSKSDVALRRCSVGRRASPLAGSGSGRVCSYRTTLSSNQGRLILPAAGGADRRSAKIAAAPINQSREAHHSARPHHSPKGGQSAAQTAADWPHEGQRPGQTLR